jgi:hypothetical protein
MCTGSAAAVASSAGLAGNIKFAQRAGRIIIKWFAMYGLCVMGFVWVALEEGLGGGIMPVYHFRNTQVSYHDMSSQPT